MHHGPHLAAPDLLSAPTLGERGDGADRLRVGLLLQDRLEVAVQPAELGGKLLLREGAARSDAFGRLVPQVRQQELEQLRGLPRRDARRGRRNGRIGGRGPGPPGGPGRPPPDGPHPGGGRQSAPAAPPPPLLHPPPPPPHPARAAAPPPPRRPPS